MAPGLNFGFAATSPTYSQKFASYSGLLPNGGSANIPATIQTGLSYNVTSSLTAMLDYKRIFYSSVPTFGNASTNLLSCQTNPSFCLGGANGAGFGAKDMNIIKLGLEWNASEALILRGGYSYNTQSARPANVEFDLFAPIVVQSHFTGGLAYKLTQNLDLEVAGMYAPRVDVVGNEFQGNPNHTIDIGMRQYELTAGIKYRFDSTPAPSFK